MTLELAALIEEQESQLEKISAGVAEGSREKVVTALGTLALGVATGHPEIAILAPLLQEGVRRAFANRATVRLQKAFAESEALEQAQTEKDAFAHQVAEGIEALLGQALIQMARVQHNVKDEVVEALGGFRDEFATFREEFQDSLDDSGIRIESQRVRDRAIGVRVSAGAARARVWIGEMTVSGEGVGIDLKGP